MAAVGQGVVIPFQLLGAPWSHLCCSGGQRVGGEVCDRWDDCLPTPDIIPTGSTICALSGPNLGPHREAYLNC